MLVNSTPTSHFYLFAQMCSRLLVNSKTLSYILFMYDKYMLFTGWQVRIGRNCARSLEYPDRYSDRWHSFSQYGPTQAGEEHFYFFPTEISKFQKIFPALSNLCAVIKVGRVRVDEARDRLQTKTKHHDFQLGNFNILWHLLLSLRMKKSFCVLLDSSLSECQTRIKELTNLKATGKKIQQRFSSSEYLL